MWLSSIRSRLSALSAPEMSAWRTTALVELALLVAVPLALQEPKLIPGATLLLLAVAAMLPLAQVASASLARRQLQGHSREASGG